jgi:hypothetical protein
MSNGIGITVSCLISHLAAWTWGGEKGGGERGSGSIRNRAASCRVLFFFPLGLRVVSLAAFRPVNVFLVGGIHFAAKAVTDVEGINTYS